MMGTDAERGKGARRGQRGSALMVAVVAISTLMIMTMAFLQITSASSAEVQRRVDDERARVAADGAVAEAVAQLLAGGTGDIGSAAAPVASGAAVYWVAQSDPGNGEVELRATALVGSGRAATVVVLESPEDPLFEGVLNAQDSLTFSSRAFADSYRSTLGTYASQATNTTGGVSHALMNASIGSNGSITMNADSTVMGDVTPGVGHVATLAPSAFVSGATAPALQPFTFPPVTAPALAGVPTGVTVPIAGALSLGAGEHLLSNFTIGKDATVEIEGPATIVCEDFSGGPSANLIIDATNGPVTFYVEGSYLHDKGFEATAAAGSPMALAFMISGTDPITFPSNTNIRGAFYAPEADISFTSGNEAWGAFIGNSVTMNADMRFHYDEDLADHWNRDSGGFSGNVLAWYPTRVQPARLLADRRDPRAVFGLQ